MTRDPGLEEVMRDDLGDLPGLSEKPMFGGLCFLSHGNMICAARQGRAMYRVGKPRNDDALALPGTSPMTHGGRAKPGYVWLHDDQLSDDATRARLTGWALDCVRDLPPKE
ncbi:TfoX/Sxy family protein [Paracoccus lutimaris]|uniref:TfoX-like protein n=1 Tax=Paracoccus lutimaris TaxID=1490030 RepID=A0A368Z7Z7_9RHOB|nr:TfoX/Sxy family protein [Paracoccus lutimaris]RCW88129.1 TfoX-like protein [Paracoccus lutimaris]